MKNYNQIPNAHVVNKEINPANYPKRSYYLKLNDEDNVTVKR